MARSRRDSYDAAALRVSAGTWIVDAEAGHVYNSRGKRLTMRNEAGYVYAQFHVGAARYSVRIHRVIWESIHGPIGHDLEINHINGDKADNRLANLEVVTAQGNTAHAITHGLRNDQPRGTNAYSARLATHEVDTVRSLYAQGMTQVAVATRMGISHSQVSKIVNRVQHA